MTLVRDAKMSARRTPIAPTPKATHDQLVSPPTTTTGTPARTAICERSSQRAADEGGGIEEQRVDDADLADQPGGLASEEDLAASRH